MCLFLFQHRCHNATSCFIVESIAWTKTEINLSKPGKENSLWLLRNSALELLRQEGAEDTGFIMRGYAGLSGGGISTCLLQELWHGETGTTFLDSQQSILHKAFCLFCGKALSGVHPPRRSEGASSGLEDRQGAGQTVYA